MQLASAALEAAHEEQARAQSDLQALRAQRQSLRLLSPVDGIVTSRDPEALEAQRKAFEESLREKARAAPAKERAAPSRRPAPARCARRTCGWASACSPC